MANTIRLKRASGSDPGASDLVTGELAVRTDTGKLFTKKDDNSVAEIGATVGSDAVNTAAIQDDAVTYAKIQNVSATNRILGRDSSGAGVIEEISPANLRTMLNVADGATNVTNTNQLTNGAGFITATLTNEQVQDIVGGMVSGNTETGITVTYQDGDGTLDFVVGTLNQDTTGNAATATALETARTIGGTSFDGTGNITPAQCTNADTVDSLHASSFVRSDAADVMSQSTQGTATLDVRNTGGAGSGTGTGALIAKFVGDSDAIEVRNIGAGDYGIYNSQQDNGFELYDGTGGVRILYNGTNALEFDSGNTYGDFKGVPTVNGTNLARVSDDITGNAATATKLATARTIAGVSFDGSANISLNNNAITNGAGYITATLTNEQVQDIVGGMVSGNTESGITVTYQDSDGTLDFAVASQTDNNFTTTLKNKLDGIASGATNVTNNNQLTNGAGYITSADGGNAATLDSIDSSQFARSDTADTLSGLMTFSGGASFSADARCAAALSTLSDGANIQVNFISGIHHTVTLGGNRTFSDPSNTANAVGQSGSIFIVQDGTGSRTASFHSDYKFAGGTAPTLSTAANAVDRLDYVIRASDNVHCVVTLDVK